MAELRIGIAGLGAASRLVLPYMDKVKGVRLAAAADIREDARVGFARVSGLPVFASVEELCGSAAVDAVWIETPNHLHCAQVIAAAERGKHVICAKPLAATLDECDRMIAACRLSGVRLLQGHSKIFDSPVRAMADVARSGRLGRVIGIDSWWYNDWLRRPRLASELDENFGAGFILRQAPHLVDIVTYVAGSRAVRVRAMAGRWDGNVPTEGNCAALIQFESGAVANLSLNGYGYFGSSELTWDIGIFGERKACGKPASRKTPLSEAKKYADGPRLERKTGDAMPFVGLTIVSCERGVMRQSPDGIYLYTDEGREEIAVPPYQGRAAEL
ncbi:MAG TPA: Gfo/Idh/MocA family oxidoreductase, partial [Micropepsaceae bacterium]|nr:Gfo/Idh/MocA family oxidoreductase [Micropepsaceae bacterium]